MGGPRIKILTVFGTVAVLEFAASPVSAHAFGARYDLPLPLTLYLVGAAAAVALSFIVMARFLKYRGEAEEALRFDLLSVPGIGWLGGSVTLNAVRSISVTVFVLLLAAGFFGNPDPLKNITPIFVWVIWWVGMAFASALVGNFWALVNPWTILFDWCEKVAGTFGPAISYPTWLSRWPAVILFLAFAWMELIFEQAEHPRTLAMSIVAYSAITWTGMIVFGRNVWLKNGEAFSVVYGLLAQFAPMVGEDGKWNVRLPAVGLLRQHPANLSTVCFVLLLLTTVSFDGILETPLWAGILGGIAESRVLQGGLILLQDEGVDLIALIKTIALAVLLCISVAVYTIFSHAIAAFGSGGRIQTRDVIGYFVLSLVPISIAYHLSHYISYLLISGQNIIPLASDPFGLGWDLFDTADYRIDIGIVNAKLLWYLSVSTIVIGHMLAVYIAHVMAMRVFPDRSAALLSQIPMLVLMIAYTMISLWILSQPIVESPDYKSLRAPSGLVSLAPGEFEEVCLDMAAKDEIRYEFRSDHPVAFDIHYHVGPTIQYPVQLNRVTKISDSFIADVDQSYCLMWSNQTTMRTTVSYQVDRP
jgi:hypothetical protein